MLALGVAATSALIPAATQARSLYVPNQDNLSVSVINTSTNTVSSTINTPGQGRLAVA